MDKKIVIKEINRLNVEYLVYLKINEKNIMCFHEIGDTSKRERVNMLLLEHFSTTPLNERILNEIIEEITIT